MSKCSICNRPLKNPDAIKAGVGKKCASRLNDVYQEARAVVGSSNENSRPSRVEILAEISANEKLLAEGLSVLQGKDKGYQRIVKLLFQINKSPSLSKEFACVNYLPVAIQKEIVNSKNEEAIEALASNDNCSVSILTYLASSSKKEVVKDVAENVLKRDIRKERLACLLHQSPHLPASTKARLKQMWDQAPKKEEAKPQVPNYQSSLPLRIRFFRKCMTV